MSKIFDEKELNKYRPIPFWSWNDKLCPEELKRQVRMMKEAGMGGFFMHARSGLVTEYLSDEWFEAIKVCMDEAEKCSMDAWCYDENGWPSGFAGMKLLEDSQNFAHYIVCETKNSFDAQALGVYVLDNNNIKRVTSDNGSAEYICVYDKTNSSVVDILNEEIVAKFIKETHEKYYERFGSQFGNKLVGFFTDEPQYFRWDTAYSPVILELYKKEYGQELLDTLGALFIDCEQSYETRFKYWRLMNKQFAKSFGKQIYDWCEEHNCQLTGHAIEEQLMSTQMWCCAGVMPFYEYEHIPGCDWLGRYVSHETTPRQVSSVAMQLGKEKVLTEIFAGAGWDVTPKELKRILEWQYVNGVNLLCTHLTPYSIRGSRKYDYPAFFAQSNPWFKHFRIFSDYFSKLGMLLAKSNELAEVAVIHPIHSAYLTYKRGEDYKSVEALEGAFASLVERLGAANIGHHYIDESLLEKYGSVENGVLTLGKCSYKKIVIPNMQGLDLSTVKLLEAFVKGGGRIYLDGQCPQYVNGKKTQLDFLKSNCTFEELKSEKIFTNDVNTQVRSTFRSSSWGEFLYAVNISENAEQTVTYKIKAGGAILYDIENEKESPVYYSKGNDFIEITLKFAPGQSYILKLDDSAEPLSKQEDTQKEEIRLSTDCKVLDFTENSLVLDKASYSFDNKEYSQRYSIYGIADYLLKQRKNTTVFLKYSFSIDNIPQSLYLETEKTNINNLWINKEKIAITHQLKDDGERVFRHDILPYVSEGTNEITLEIDYSQAEKVYYTLFDMPDVTESVINCLTYDTEPEPICLKGDFAVTSVQQKLNELVYIAEDNFAITDTKKDLDCKSINTQGFVFFAGDIRLELNPFELTRKDYRLKLKGRYAAAQIEVNSENAGVIMLEDELDISKFLKVGTNKITITLSSGGRNHFGPFHTKNEPEPLFVGPTTFSMKDSWKDCQSEAYSEDYAFVKFGIEEIKLI
ncbi:MAG: hypothetical protein E7480_02560 [Ruminococcaceae bacterium]|nr:hypothetical protein [Oscillospiraceae bacterium]